MKRYPSIRYPGEEEAEGVFSTGDIVIMEKMDGGNFRFTHERNIEEEYHEDNRDIVFGSRNVIYKNSKDETKQFGSQMEYVRECVDPADIIHLEEEFGEPLTFYGEAMVPHTLEYDWENTPEFLGFDVYCEESEKFLTHEEMHYAFNTLGLPIAPTIDIVSAEAWDDYNVDVSESEFGNCIAEGLTFKNYETQTFSKFVRDDFKEKAHKTFGKSKSQQKEGYEKLSYRYITNARIEKSAHKLVDEGDWSSLQMKMMEDLPTAVITDMAEEEAANIFMKENWEVDIAEFRSLTSSRCAQVLKRMINERAAKEIRQS